MRDELIDRLRAADPLPEGSTAPAMESVLQQIRAADAEPRRRQASRFAGPAFAVASVVAVLGVSVAVLTTRPHRPAHPARRTSTPSSPTTPRVPRGGLRGWIFLWGAGFPTPRGGVISLQQCLGCHDGGSTPQARYRNWLLTTSDGGASWRLSKRPYYLQQPLFAGRDGWAGGLQAGAEGGGFAEYYVTHDGGRSWTRAPSDAPNQGGALVSVGGGEVWATGLFPTQVEILHAPVTGGRLKATRAQPIRGGQTNVSVIAGGSGTAYVANSTVARELFVTRDDGRTWRRMAPPCGQGETPRLLAADAGAVWADCLSPQGRSRALARSTDAGRSWRALPPVSGGVGPPELQPLGGGLVWALTPNGTVLRSTDAGQSWQLVWSQSNPAQAPLRSRPRRLWMLGAQPILVAQSASSATVVSLVLHRSPRGQGELANLAVYRTSDGGRTWQPAVVALSPR